MFDTSGVDAPAKEITDLAGVGVGVGTLYRHFPQRSDLVKAVLERLRPTLSALLDAAATSLVPVVLDDLSAGRRSSPPAARATRGRSPTPPCSTGPSTSMPTWRRSCTAPRGSSCPSRWPSPPALREQRRRHSAAGAAARGARMYPSVVQLVRVDLRVARWRLRRRRVGPGRPASPYARSKAMAEQILADVAATGDLRVLSLRYFNPIGADPQLRTGLRHRLPTHALGRQIIAQRAGGPVHGGRHGLADPRRVGRSATSSTSGTSLRARPALRCGSTPRSKGPTSGRSISARAAGRPCGNWWRRSAAWPTS